MMGAIIGDIVGSRFEWRNIKSKDFEFLNDRSHYTDDTVLTIAIASAILKGEDYAKSLHWFGNEYRGKGYGGRFSQWLCESQPGEPYGSFGNGSAMRVSPTAYISDDLEEVLHEAMRSAAVTHNHPEGIKGAQATAAAIFLARKGRSKQEIKDFNQDRFGYNLEDSLADIRPTYSFDESCQGTVPQAIISFLESETFEDAIRNAISLGGDSDTLACITGGIAGAFYGVPADIRVAAMKYLPQEFQDVIETFERRFV